MGAPKADNRAMFVKFETNANPAGLDARGACRRRDMMRYPPCVGGFVDSVECCERVVRTGRRNQRFRYGDVGGARHRQLVTSFDLQRGACARSNARYG